MKKSGFTLVELIVVIAIVAIVVAVAIPNYQESVRKSRRADAQTELLEFAGTAERVFNQDNSYAAVALPPNNDYYTFTFPVEVTATAYTVRATPKGTQTADGCGTMTLTQTGVRTHTGELADCW